MLPDSGHEMLPAAASDGNSDQLRYILEMGCDIDSIQVVRCSGIDHISIKLRLLSAPSDNCKCP